MEAILNGITNVLKFLNDYWTAIVIIIGLVIALVQKIKSYVSKSNEEKIQIAKEQINQIVLKLVSDAEDNYADMDGAGSIKRSQVIEQIYSQFPILSKAVSQEEITEYIDEAIDTALDTLRDITKGE